MPTYKVTLKGSSTVNADSHVAARKLVIEGIRQINTVPNLILITLKTEKVKT